MLSNRQEDLSYNKQDVINAFKQVERCQLQQTGFNQCIQTGRKISFTTKQDVMNAFKQVEDLGYNKQDVINAFIQVGKPRLQQAGCNQCFQTGRKISVTTNRM